MPRICLTKDEIRELASLLSEVFEHRIVPNINAQGISFGGREADIVVETSSGEALKIEVKATGSSAFEYFGEKDIASDYLVWIHFGSFFMNAGERFIDIFIIRDPSQYFSGPVKITLRKFRELIGTNVQQLRLNIDEL